MGKGLQPLFSMQPAPARLGGCCPATSSSHIHRACSMPASPGTQCPDSALRAPAGGGRSRLDVPDPGERRGEEGAPALPGAVRLHLAAGGARCPGPPAAPAAGKPRRCLISPRPGASSTSRPRRPPPPPRERCRGGVSPAEEGGQGREAITRLPLIC